MSTALPAVAQATRGEPADTFEPGKVNKDRRGGRPDGPARAAAPAAGGAARELVEERTATSRTYVLPDGTQRREVFASPVQYRDEAGRWRDVDTRLVATDDGWRQAAGDHDLHLPKDLAQAPVRLSRDGESVAFALHNAAPAAADTAGNRALYRDALPGVDVSLAATPQGVKEDLILREQVDAAAFSYDLRLSDGLTPTVDASGAVTFSTDEGVAFVMPAPFMYDSADTQAVSSDIDVTLDERAGGWTLTLTPDAGWLGDDERVWPVVIDPSYLWPNDSGNCTLQSAAPDTNACNQPTMDVEGGANRQRALLWFDVQNPFDEPVTVLDARLELNLSDDSPQGASAPLAVHRVGQHWGYSATWNSAKTGVAWDTAGGTIAPRQALHYEQADKPGWRLWSITKLVQGWQDGDFGLWGMIVKYDDESSGARLGFNTWAASAQVGDARVPKLVMDYAFVTGDVGLYSYERFELSDRSVAGVNVANGNLVLTEQDFTVAGTGLDAFFERRHNSLGIDNYTDRAKRWTMFPWSTWLQCPADGTVKFFTDRWYVFTPDGNGGFTSPRGLEATLTKRTDGDYELSYHRSGEKWRFAGCGGLFRMEDRNGNHIFLDWNTANGFYQVVTMTDTRGRVTNFEISSTAPHVVTKVTDPAGREHRYGYDSSRRLTSYTNPANQTTTYTYDSYDNLVDITDPTGRKTRFVYHVNSTTSEKNRYNERRIKQVIRVDDTTTNTGPTWEFAYYDTDRYANRTVVTDPNGNQTTYHYGRRGQVTKVVDALGHERSSKYNSNGNVTRYTGEVGGTPTVNTYSTDGRFNLESVELPTGATSTFTSNNPRNVFAPDTYTSPQGNALTYDYDTPGNLATVKDDQATVTSCPTTATSPWPAGCTWVKRNPNGTVDTVTDQRGKVTDYNYDTAGNLTVIDPPGTAVGNTTIGYDSVSRVTSVTDGKGQTTTYGYDVLDRVTSVTFHGGATVTYAYDNNGNRTSQTDATGTTSTSYDALNRITGETLPDNRTNTYTYDASSNLATFTDAGGTVTYGYNTVNLLATLTDPQGLVTTFGYDGRNNRSCTSYPNGVEQRIDFDASNRARTIQAGPLTSGRAACTDATPTNNTVVYTAADVATGLSSTFTKYGYVYAKAGSDTGLRHSVTDTDDNTTAYTYDGLDRLTQAQTTNSSGTVTKTYAYAYDAASNRTKQQIDAATPTWYRYGEANELCWTAVAASMPTTACGSTPTNGVRYTFDANGNQTGNTAGQAIAYDTGDRSTSMKRDSAAAALTASYAGDTQVDRRATSAATFTPSILGVSVRAGEFSRTDYYTRDNTGGLVGRRWGTTTSTKDYYLFDGLGSVVAQVDGTGAVSRRYSYDPYGVTTPQSATGAALSDPTTDNNPWRYTGEYQDRQTGLYKIGHRYYQTDLGRWTQRDPLEGRINETRPSEVHPYAYVGCDPTNSTDPTGLISDCFWGCLISLCYPVVIGCAPLGPLAPQCILELCGIVVVAICREGCRLIGQ